MSSDGFHDNPFDRILACDRFKWVLRCDTATTLTHHRRSGTNPLGREVGDTYMWPRLAIDMRFSGMTLATGKHCTWLKAEQRASKHL
jgi:hypothetical protein